MDEVILKLEKQIKKLALQDWANEIQSLSEDEIKKIIVSCDGNAFTIKKQMSEDEKLQAAKEVLKDLASGYKEAIQVQKIKSEYCVHLLECRGTHVGDKLEED
jgi:hypothetical protein